MEGLLSFLALVVVLYLGFTILALSQYKQRCVVGWATPLPHVKVILLRVSGYGLLALALALSLWRDGPGFGSLQWVCLLSATAFTVTATLTWRPHWLRPFAWLGGRTAIKTEAMEVVDERPGNRGLR